MNNASDIIQAMMSRPDIDADTRHNLTTFLDILANGSAYTVNEVQLVQAGVYMLETMLRGEVKSLGELYTYQNPESNTRSADYIRRRVEIIKALRSVLGISLHKAAVMATQLLAKGKYAIWSASDDANLCLSSVNLNAAQIGYIRLNAEEP